MSELQLFPGPRLVRKSWVYDDDQGVGDWVSTNVTDRAFEYLFHELVTDPEVTLADVFGLVMDEPIMQAVFRQEFVVELCAEVRKGPVAKEEEAWQRIEYLELYQLWNFETATAIFEEVGRYHLHGVGVVQEADIFEHEHLAHTRGELSGQFSLHRCASCCICQFASIERRSFVRPTLTPNSTRKRCKLSKASASRWAALFGRFCGSCRGTVRLKTVKNSAKV